MIAALGFPVILRSKFNLWKARQHDRSSLKKHGQKSIALGFAWPAENIGGVRRHLESIGNYSSHPVSLYPSKYASGLLDNGVERNTYHRNLKNVKSENHSLFHSHVDPRFINLSKRAHNNGVPWIHTYHALYFEEDWGYNLAPWQTQINKCLLLDAKHADICLAVGSWLVDWLKENHDIDSVYLPNGVDIDACDRAAADRFTNKYDIIDFALFVGSLSGIKNPLAFIKAAKEFPDTEFVMIGTGLIKEELEKTFGCQISDNIVPLGPLSHDQALDAIAACKVFVMTSHREGLPTVLLEAMSMEKTCVVPNAPWVSDVVKSDETGLKYEPGNIEELVEKIKIAMSIDNLPVARQHVVTSFSWQVVIKQLDQIYSGLIK